jgi:hypothetical protein
MALWQLILGFASLIGITASVVAITLGVRRYYRCPECESVPLGSWTSLGPGNIGKSWGLDLNTSVCSKCGARLR